jgi:type II secretory pathway component PulF
MDDNDFIWELVLKGFVFLLAVLVVFLAVRLIIGILQFIHYCLTLPLRRAERARSFLWLVDTTLQQGLPLEETIISLARSRDESMGIQFHLFAAWLESGLSFEAALAKVPRFLPPQISAMLAAGKQMGDLAKVLPAGRQLLSDATSHMRGALNYLVILTLVISPFSMYVFCLLTILVFPKFIEVSEGMGSIGGVAFLSFLTGHFWEVVLLQGALLLLLWAAALTYIGGPRVTAWFPVLERVHYRLPWRRRRMQRDFSTLLALLLDAGVPEAEALTLAADCTANSVFRRRAARAVAALRSGLKLPDAVHQLDDAGEFRWRLRNAVAAPGGFFRALAGWHDSLDARAFQQEQAAAHVITTSLVLWCGLLVGAIAISVFMFLTSMINAGVLW